MPLWLVQLYAEEMTRLRAGENIDMANAFGLGTGSMKKGAAEQLRNRWGREARGSGQRARAASLADLASMGIGVKK